MNIFLIFGETKGKETETVKIWLTADRRKCTLWDSYYLAKLAVIERIRIEYQHYIHSIESKDNDLVYLSILNEIDNGFHVCGRVCPVYAYEKEQVLYPEVMKFLDKLKIPVKLRIPGQSASGILFSFSLLQQVLPVFKTVFHQQSRFSVLCNNSRGIPHYHKSPDGTAQNAGSR